MQTKNTKKNTMEKNMKHPTTSVVFSLILTFLFLASSTIPSTAMTAIPSTLCLSMGIAWEHGHGHNVTAIDLAASGINLVRVTEIRTFSDYSKPLIDFMESIPENERVILVGHSLGGVAISQAMELFPEKVSVGALSTLGSALDNKLSFDDGPNSPPTTFIFGPNYISQVLFQFSPPPDAALANVLVRPLRLTTGGELVFSKARYGSVNRIFIISER
ncbi:hypothetical protein Cgig2_020080 [Carnegiea gigantea]|uniref:AB hydrolase-1 domain-containing protein n=1 Tax=Carnegiea gigantea TaxID=171969 RepID=A0A9Q1KEB2_9CARY|nr:hypothetical protein Cgig2_020080 [Carnegiea gigantea]